MVALFDNVTPLSVKQDKNAWYTPAKYIEAARTVMGKIDLDPASCALANETVKAKRYYTQHDNGLAQEWTVDGCPSCVWLNPPYGRIGSENGGNKGYTPLFVRRLLHEYRAGNVVQAILLVLGNACFMKWFYPLWEFPMCFHDGRIYFDLPDGSKSDFGFGNTFIYLGPNESKFVEVFSQFGTIAKRVSPSRERPMPVRTLWDMEAQP